MLHYQPQVDSAGRWVGAEALDPLEPSARGPISAVEFIPLAEQSGLMATIDKCILERLRDAAAGTTTPTRDLQLAVNVGAHR